MQIDFHHTVTYVAARLAGFLPIEAGIISRSAQYVDDAVSSGVIRFSNKAMYSRISSAHKTLDYRNFQELGNNYVWVPFHFLPGNDGQEAGADTGDGFVHRLVCKPESPVCMDMVKSCIDDCGKEFGLHRLGITMHVLADTFSHQNFTGINHKINEVHDLKMEHGKEHSFFDKMKVYFSDGYDRIRNQFVSDVFPLGHGAALTCPDLPYLSWEYTDGHGNRIHRDNTEIFTKAVICMHKAMVKYRKKDSEYSLGTDEEIPAKDLEKISENFRSFIDEKETFRHTRWLNSINNGDFSFVEKGKEDLDYVINDIGCWKHTALIPDNEVSAKDVLYRFSDEFLSSDWKMFHDALQIHRITVIRQILPKYGICVA